ncbi:Hypothetical protein LBF_2105 [Leptospira biflexa serovar Patoc strain 'Patoc 1 (Ames)']|uniref:Glyoxalase-like domain-containing protein n=1 Tax=Leptospira biflexa serovar Patoc (strain Patoc 1 / ATCC 23582 / Paris) TaxID=456481 RepID=B0ST23_LEPBP|nr:hypothetical protein [Leptospira biflexa]ABZ94601.1 Hypothetical protein LBF_2105 [Leptospira biflexa serovar Patoc strain 'Patoc 1 (Ames)']ABZ98263.1 Hypothetical protein LEPBI_I2162 [Leptospira biflexa serovar Patoc strain 'Patoc 1 (Paris)']
MEIKPTFDHFLIYSQNLESDFKRFKDRFDFPIIYPITNYGVFSSCMFACKNSILELVNYENPKIPENYKGSTIWFSGFALKSDLTIDKILSGLTNSNLKISDIIIQNVKDKDGNNIPITKILMINELFNFFQVFYIQYLNRFLEEKFIETSKEAKWEILSFEVNENQSDTISEKLKNAGFSFFKNDIFYDNNKIKFTLKKSNFDFPIVSSFLLKSNKEIVDLVKFF